MLVLFIANPSETGPMEYIGKVDRHWKKYESEERSLTTTRKAFSGTLCSPAKIPTGSDKNAAASAAAPASSLLTSCVSSSSSSVVIKGSWQQLLPTKIKKKRFHEK